jgi:hypothetical protein
MVPFSLTFLFSLEFEVLPAPFIPLLNEESISLEVLEFIICYESYSSMTLTANEYIFSDANVSERDTSIL